MYYAHLYAPVISINVSFLYPEYFLKQAEKRRSTSVRDSKEWISECLNAGHQPDGKF